MSEPAQLAKTAREQLASALNALQTGGEVPDELMEVAEPIAETMSILHRIERSNGADLEGRGDALKHIRGALDRLQAITVQHPAIDTVMDAVATSLSKIHALTRVAAPAAGAARSPAQAIPTPFTAHPSPVAAQPNAPAPFAAPAQPASFAQPQPAPFAQPQPAPFAQPQPQPASFAQQPAPFAQQPAPFAQQPAPFAQQQPAPFAQPPAPFAQQQPAPFAQQPAPFTQPQAAPFAQPQAAPQPSFAAPVGGGQHPFAPSPFGGGAPPAAQQPFMPPAPYGAPPPQASPFGAPGGAAGFAQPMNAGGGAGFAQPMNAGSPLAATAPLAPMSPLAGQPAAHAHAAPHAEPPQARRESAPRTAGAAGPSGNIDVELGAHSASNFYKGLGGNDVIEHGGIFVATYKIPKIGSTVMLRVLLPGDFEFQANAVVQWTREAGGGESADPGFGARFTQITPEGRQLVYRYTRNREPIFYDDL